MHGNRRDLDNAGFFDLIMYKAARGHPLSEAQRRVNHAVSRVRGSVERAFGGMKKHYGLGRAKYLGVGKASMQLIQIAANLDSGAKRYLKIAIAFVHWSQDRRTTFCRVSS